MGLFFPAPGQKAEKLYQKGKALLLESAIKNQHKANELFLQAAQLGHADAQFQYGRYLIIYAEKPAQALEWLEKAAAQGHENALRCCVALYSGTEGGLPPDLDKAAVWAQRAKERGMADGEALWRAVESRRDPATLYQLALAELEGDDHHPAMADLERAAGQGYLPAQLKCGEIYEKGTHGARFTDDNILPNREKAIDWYQKAAWQGDAEAQYRLAKQLTNKKDGDKASALSWYGKAAGQGHTAALARYLTLYTPGETGEELKAWAQAARGGDAWAGFLCAELRCRGEQVPVKDDELFSWCEKAAQGGRPEPRYRWGYMCAQGIGTAADPQKAAALSEGGRAADLPMEAACGRMYLLGEGTARDRERAWLWYREALRRVDADCPADRGSDWDKALLDLGRAFFWRGQEDTALSLLEDAAEDGLGYTHAFLLLAALYRHGTAGGVLPDEQRARLWFSRWLRSARPGDTIRFGRHPQDKAPRDYERGAFPEPVHWTVLEVEPDRALLLCCCGLGYSYGRVRKNLFSDTEKTLVQGEPFHLSQAQTRKYLVEKQLAPLAISATFYAAICMAEARELSYTISKGGKRLEISGKGWADDRWEKEEWEKKKEWIRILTSRTSQWALSDGAVDVAGKLQESYVKEITVSRPAVWLGLAPPTEAP